MDINTQKLEAVVQDGLASLEKNFVTTTTAFIGKIGDAEIHLTVTRDDNELFGGDPNTPIIVLERNGAGKSERNADSADTDT